MEYGHELWKSLQASPSQNLIKESNDSKEFVINKKKLQKFTTSALNMLSPMAKASLIGLALDSLPYLLITRLKLSQSLSWAEIIKLISNFNQDLTNGALTQRIFKNYPKRDSWLTTFLFSVLVFQLSSPSPPIACPSTILDKEVCFSDNLKSSLQEGLNIELEEKTPIETIPETTNQVEYKTVAKHFLASLASTSVGLWFLRFNTNYTASSKKRGNHVSLALYSIVQAGHAVWSFQRLRSETLSKTWQVKTPWIDFNLKSFGRIAEALLFGLSSYQVMMTWFFHPKNLPPSYEKWITRFSEIEPTLLYYLRELWKGTIVEGKHSDFLSKYCLSLGLSPHLGDPFYGVPSCQLVHSVPGDSCPKHVLRRFYRTFMKAFISVYLPLNLFAFILKRRSKPKQDEKKPQKSPIQLATERILYPAMRSSAFLGTFVATIFGSVCFVRQTCNTDKYGAVLGSILCGFASILVESPSRRLNLTLYLIPRALDTFYQGRLKKIIPARSIENPLFAISLATLLTCFRLQPSSVQAPLRTLLNWVFSNNLKSNHSTPILSK